jgi:hypothetical protein
MSKSSAQRHLSAMRDAGVVERAGRGRTAGWKLAGRPEPPAAAQPQPYVTVEMLAQPQPYVTVEMLAQLVHDGVIQADGEQREILEQAWQLAHPRPQLTVLQGGGGSAQ